MRAPKEFYATGNAYLAGKRSQGARREQRLHLPAGDCRYAFAKLDSSSLLAATYMSRTMPRCSLRCHSAWSHNSAAVVFIS